MASSLPVELWWQVLANVSHGDLCNVMVTSRHMNTVASWPELWVGMEVNIEMARVSGLAQFYSINRFKKIKKMCFENMFLTKMELERLLKDVPGSPLEIICFEGTNLSRVSPHLLASAVKSLKTVNLSYTNLTTHQCIKVLEASLPSIRLVDLDLAYVDLSEVPRILQEGVYKEITTGSFVDTNPTTDLCIKAIEASLSSTILEDLYLRGVNLSGVPPNLLVSTVKRIMTVDLSDTHLTTDQCVNILDDIFSSTTSVKLYLEPDQSIKVIKENLFSKTLVDLDLRVINLSAVPSNLLASAVKRLTTVEFSGTDRNLTTDQTINMLEACLSSTTLVDLYLEYVNLSDIPFNLLAAKRLTTVDLYHSDLTTDQCIHIPNTSLMIQCRIRQN